MSPRSSHSRALAHVIEINEGAKTIAGYAHQVNLRALDAIVRSVQSGHQLRGFSEVSSQMRTWTHELREAVTAVTEHSRLLVSSMSAHARKRRLAALIDDAASRAPSGRLGKLAERVGNELDERSSELRAVRRQLGRALQDLERMGLMASVLAQAALIEAASGVSPEQRTSLSEVSKGFAEQAELVNRAIRSMLASSREDSV